MHRVTCTNQHESIDSLKRLLHFLVQQRRQVAVKITVTTEAEHKHNTPTENTSKSTISNEL